MTVFCWKAGLGLTTGLGAKDLDAAPGDGDAEPNVDVDEPNDTLGVGAGKADGPVAGVPDLNPADGETPGFADAATAAPIEKPGDALTSADGVAGLAVAFAAEGVTEAAFGTGEVLGAKVSLAAGVALAAEAA